MKRNRIVSGALAGILLLGLTACANSQTPVEEDTAPAGIAVQVISVEKDDISTDNKVSGKITADNEAMIMVGTAAKCVEVYAQAGDLLNAGDKICKLDLGSTLATYNAAKIGYNSATQSYQDQKAILEKQIALAKDNVANTKELFAIGAASQLEVDQAELNYQNALAGKNSALSQLEAGIQNAKSGVEQLKVVMENIDQDGNVIAPMAGTLVNMNASAGSFVSTNMPVAVVDGVDQMKVMVSVSEALVPKLRAGDKADVTVTAANQTFEGTIRAVERAANMQTKLYTVTLTVPEDVSDLMNGMFADVVFHTDTSEDTLVVPTEAIMTSGTTQYVYVVDGDAARYAEVTVGLTGNGVTEITSGLNAGDQLVTVGQSYLKDGSAVRIVSGED